MTADLQVLNKPGLLKAHPSESLQHIWKNQQFQAAYVF